MCSYNSRIVCYVHVTLLGPESGQKETVLLSARTGVIFAIARREHG